MGYAARARMSLSTSRSSGTQRAELVFCTGPGPSHSGGLGFKDTQRAAARPAPASSPASGAPALPGQPVRQGAPSPPAPPAWRAELAGLLAPGSLSLLGLAKRA